MKHGVYNINDSVGARCAHAPLFSEPPNEAFEKILEVKVYVYKDGVTQNVDFLLLT